MKRVIVRWFCALVVAMVILPVYAEDSGSDAGYSFNALDADGDGVVSRTEYIDGMKATIFERLDKNGDGNIVSTEWILIGDNPRIDEHFKHMDTNNDNKVDYSEFSTAIDEHSNANDKFKKLDKNADGYLGMDEDDARPGLTFFDMKI